MKVIGISNEVFSDVGEFIGYVLFLDSDVELRNSQLWEIADLLKGYVSTLAIVKTKHGYHFVSFDILKLSKYQYANMLLGIQDYLRIFDDRHLSNFIKFGRSILRISNRFNDKLYVVDFYDWTSRDVVFISGIHYFMYKSLIKYGDKISVNDDYIVNTQTTIERYKRRWFK